MRFSKQPQPQGGFVAIVSLLVLLTFGFGAVYVLHQRQMAQGRQLKRVLEQRLSQEMTREMQRLQSLPGQQRSGVPGDDLATQALDHLLNKALDRLAALEERRARLRHLARRARSIHERQAARRGLRGLDQEINLVRFWILLIETRHQQYRQGGARSPPRESQGRRATAAPSSDDALPVLPDWW